MKVTKFDIANKVATYNEELSGVGLAASIRKWREAFYLIKRGYTLRSMNDACGLCFECSYLGDCSDSKCPLRNTGFCTSIRNSYEPINKSIKEVHAKWKYLREEVDKAAGQKTKTKFKMPKLAGYSVEASYMSTDTNLS